VKIGSGGNHGGGIVMTDEFGVGSSMSVRGESWGVSCESELVAAFLCLIGGCLSRHPFVNTAGPSPAAPAFGGTQSRFYDSLADGGAFSSG
jgi:hypothetical protein